MPVKRVRRNLLSLLAPPLFFPELSLTSVKSDGDSEVHLDYQYVQLNFRFSARLDQGKGENAGKEEEVPTKLTRSSSAQRLLLASDSDQIR